MKPLPKFFRTVQVALLISTLFWGLIGCRSFQSDLGQMTGAPAEFTQVLLHEPALLLKIRPGEADQVDIPLATMLLGDESGESPWEPREILRHIDALFTSVSSSDFADSSNHSWLAVNTSLSQEFIAGLDSELPFSSSSWPEALHVRILIPISEGAPNLDAAFENWHAPEGPIEVVTHTRVLEHYILVDALLVDAELEASRRSALMERVQQSSSPLETLRITPAFEGFLESQSALAIYAPMDGLANLASMRKALSLRKDSFSDLSKLQSTLNWLGAIRSLLIERDHLRHADRRAEDFTLTIEPGESGEQLRGQLLATPMGGLTTGSTNRLEQRLPVPAANPSIFEMEMAYDLQRELARSALPYWTLSSSGYDPRRASDIVEESISGPLVIANSPSLALRFFDRDRWPSPIAFRMRAYPAESPESEPFLPRVAFAGRFIDEVTLKATFEGLVNFYREHDESADFRILPEDDGYAVALFTRNMEIADAFPEISDHTPVSPFALQTETEPTFKWLANDILFGPRPIERLVENDPIIDHLSMSAASNESIWALHFTWGSGPVASPPELKPHDITLAQYPSDCRSTLLTQERYQRGAFLRGGFLRRDNTHESDHFALLIERIEQCGAGPTTDLGWLTPANREDAFDFEAARLGFSESCKAGHDESCRAERRLTPLPEMIPELPRFVWTPTNSPSSECTASTYLFIDSDGLHLNEKRVGALDSEDIAESLMEALDDVPLQENADLYRHYPTAMTSRRRQVALFASPETDALQLLKVLRELQLLNHDDPLDFVALARAPNDELACFPLTMASSAEESPEESTRIDLHLSSRGFDLHQDDQPMEPILRCPAEGATVCLRSEQLGLPPDRVFHPLLSPPLADYDFARLLRFASDASEKHLEVRTSIALKDNISWVLFLKSVDVMTQPTTTLNWGDRELMESSSPSHHSSQPRLEVSAP